MLVIIYLIVLGMLVGLHYTDHAVLFYTFPVIGMQGFVWATFKYFYSIVTLGNWIVVVEANQSGTVNFGDSDNQVIRDPNATSGTDLIHFSNAEGVVIVVAIFSLSLYLHDKWHLLGPNEEKMKSLYESKLRRQQHFPLHNINSSDHQAAGDVKFTLLDFLESEAFDSSFY